MEYKFIKAWVEQSAPQIIGKGIWEVKVWREHLAIYFRNRKEFLHLSFDNINPLLFTTDSTTIPFQKDSKVEVFSTHLRHAIIKDIEIDRDDRIVTLSCQKVDIYNNVVEYRLIFEMIPRQINLILSRVENVRESVIIDSWRYITFANTPYRQVIPGVAYQKPDFNKFVIEKERVEYPIKITDVFPKVADDYSSQSLNDLFSYYIHNKVLTAEFERYKKRLVNQIEVQIARKERKISKLEVELSESDKFEVYKKYGELLKYNIHLIRKGMEEVEVTDFFDVEYSPIVIPISAEVSPQENVSNYFKKYRKGLRGQELIAEQIEKTKEEVEELQSEIFDIEEIELIEYLNHTVRKSTKSTSIQKKRERFKRLTISPDWEILIGKTSRENDELTCRVAKPTDWWFHSRVFQGSHVVLRNYKKQEPNYELIMLCSRLAGYYSKAKNSSNVPVDYTQIRYVTKPHGSPPGYVIYKNQKTVFVTPMSLREAVAQINEDRER